MSEDAGTAPATEAAPAKGAPAKVLTLVRNLKPAPIATATPKPVAALPLRWERDLIGKTDIPARELPRYGTPEWAAADDAAKVASCVLSAYNWRTRHYGPDAPISGARNRARRIAEAQKPREGDFPGGSVPTW